MVALHVGGYFFTLKLQEKTELDIEWWKSQNIVKLIYTVKTENCKKKKEVFLICSSMNFEWNTMIAKIQYLIR